MADKEQVEILRNGIDVWNTWRDESPNISPDLKRINLSKAELSRANLRGADLTGADLVGANLGRANLQGAILRRANLERAYLRAANLNGADLKRARFLRAHAEDADLGGADLQWARLTRSNFVGANFEDAKLMQANLGWVNFTGAYLERADLGNARLIQTVLSDIDLSTTKGLSHCAHSGPCTIDHRTITKSKNVPLVFWRGCGLPDALIDYMPSLTIEAMQFYSCFISYSSENQEFAERLHADLQDKGVRCWFAPHDLPIGKKILDGVDEAIRLRDRVILILSESAIASDWVEDEVTTAFEEERQRKETILFPIRLDDAVIRTNEAWASKLRARNIGDFTKWKDHDTYKATFERVLRDLRADR